MFTKLFRNTLLFTAFAVIMASCASPTPTPAPASESLAATEQPTAVAAVPFSHTACASGVDLTGQTVSFYHILNPTDQVATVYDPLRAGYADAAEYFNAHGGICGSTLMQVFDDTHWGSTQTIYDLFSAIDPKPIIFTIYSSGDGELLADQLAADKIPALNIRGGSIASAYGKDGQTLGWVFATNPLYVDQVGAMCDYIVANPDRFPHPVIGFINFDDDWAHTATDDSHTYCESLGIGYAGASYFSNDDTYIHPHVQKLIDAGANILYTNSHENGPALIAKTLFEMGLQDKVTLATVNRAMDPYVAFSGEANLGADGLPMINGMLGSLPVRSWAETDNPGIQLITAQADLHQRPITIRTDGYIMGWDTTDLLVEVYIQTGNRVGFDHITGADIKKTLENIVYTPLGGVEQIDYHGGTRRALAADRIGEMNYLGQDGKTAAGVGNPPMMVTVGGQQFLVPMIVPMTDYQPAPDLRLGGASVPPATEILPTNTLEPTAVQVALGVVAGHIAFQTNRDGNYEIYVMNGDGSGLTNLTNNPADDWAPVWSPDGNKIVYSSNRDGNNEVYVMNADGSNQTNLTNSPANDRNPDWSPDGKKIAFDTDVDGNGEIYVMNSDGSVKTNLTNAPEMHDIFPKWSTDGTQIGFTSDRDDNDEIYVMNADGSNPTRLTTNPQGDDAFPRWSPDGKQIVFESGQGDGSYEIYLMNSGGSNRTRLTDSPGSNDNTTGARWSPDGTQIIYWSGPDGNRDLYVMNADGTNQTRLTNNPGDDSDPTWKP